MRMRKSLALLLGAAWRKRRSVHGLRGGGRNYERSRALSPNISNLFAQRAKLPAPPLFFLPHSIIDAFARKQKTSSIRRPCLGNSTFRWQAQSHLSRFPFFYIYLAIF